MPCDDYETYCGNGSQEHLAKLTVDVLADINKALGIKPSFGVPDDELFNRKNSHFNRRGPYTLLHPNARRTTPRFFEGNSRVYEFNDLTWRTRENQRIFKRPNYRGLYTYNTGTIFLHKPHWCRKTLIHEVLHGTSVFSRIELNQRYLGFLRIQDSFIESITETLTGYVLSQTHPDCCTGWIENRYRECSIGGYKPRVRLWCSLCQHIGITDLAEFYLSSSDSFNDPWNQFQEEVQKRGFPEFNFTIDERIPYNEMEFREMTFRSIPDLRDTYEDPTRHLDLWQI